MNLSDNKIAFGLAQELLSEGQNVTLQVRGRSMLPFFRSGSVVTLRPAAPSDLVRGNVAFGRTEGGNYVIHRIFRVDAKNVTLLGDGNVAGTETIPRERIYGIVDCGRAHMFFAKIWMWARPARRYPLGVLRRIYEE